MGSTIDKQAAKHNSLNSLHDAAGSTINAKCGNDAYLGG